jgi:hypothetical protein
MAKNNAPDPTLSEPQENLLGWLKDGGEKGRVVPGRAGGTARVLRDMGLAEYVPGSPVGEAPPQRLTEAGKVRLEAVSKR